MVAVNVGPTTLDLNGIRAGDRNLLAVSLTSKGVPINLTGMAVAAQARLRAAEPIALSAVCTITDAAAGQLTVRWPGDEVRAMLAGAEKWTGVWDLQIGTEPGTAQTVVAGKFVAELDVTRSA